MRPRSLHLRGFTVFRKMDQPVSFVDADLFALTGPTGSGKTSLLDAMCFALYGRVPRLDARAVEPVIALGAPEARVLFEFSVGDDRYTAARVVQRTKTGATTSEARLELRFEGEAPVVLASGADEMNDTVADLLGLTFDHFTKTVLLPQGAFAAFLHDTPARRQDLLRTLLDLGVYEQMRELAQHRMSRAEGEKAALDREVSRLSDITEEVERNADTKVVAIRRSADAIREIQPELDRLAADILEAERSMASTSRLVVSLDDLEIPAEVLAIADALERAAVAITSAEAVLREATDQVVMAEKRAATLPEVTELSALEAQWKRRRTLLERKEKGRLLTEEGKQRLRDAGGRLTSALAAEIEARAAVSDVETRHRAQSIARELEVGSECPVCLQRVSDLPHHAPVPALDDARSALEAASYAARSATEAEAAAHAHLESCEGTLVAIESELAEVDAFLDGKPSEVTVRENLAEIRHRSAELAILREAERVCQAALDQARTHFSEVKRTESEGRRRLASTRDRLTDAAPPDLALDDLLMDWKMLSEWAGVRRRDLSAELAGLTDRTKSLRASRAELESAVEGELAIHDLDHGTGPPIERLIGALADAEVDLGRIRADREAAARAARQLATVSRNAEISKSLARHLQAGGFEGWLMEEALHGLVAGANALLDQLSSGAYSLHMSKRDFVVIDHRNADETRGVKTLSGGETFLVSLALALSLAEQIGAMAAGGSARLESIFLDEGFGTLDVDTLDVVAAVIQELGASGRTVGIVTHVTELAELVPTRFEVVRAAGGSSVMRIDT